jgi:hypothetical protein
MSCPGPASCDNPLDGERCCCMATKYSLRHATNLSERLMLTLVKAFQPENPQCNEKAAFSGMKRK